uniref:Uncharacterized protein n=1 Tax=Micrurus lemniscatus lemniscatus TaxID=129467 RepID=A0A2D4JDB7_MICLE
MGMPDFTLFISDFSFCAWCFKRQCSSPLEALKNWELPSWKRSVISSIPGLQRVCICELIIASQSLNVSLYLQMQLVKKSCLSNCYTVCSLKRALALTQMNGVNIRKDFSPTLVD